MRGEVAHLRAELIQRYRAETAETAETADGGGGGTGAGGRTVAELPAASEARYAERERLAEQRRAQERARRERAAAVARAEHLDALALREEQAWEQADTLIDTTRPRDYDTATTLLADLRAVSERKGRLDAFDRRFQRLCHRHARKPSLLQRLERAGLPVAAE